jgi:hypothetical protein
MLGSAFPGATLLGARIALERRNAAKLAGAGSMAAGHAWQLGAVLWRARGQWQPSR